MGPDGECSSTPSAACGRVGRSRALPVRTEGTGIPEKSRLDLRRKGRGGLTLSRLALALRVGLGGTDPTSETQLSRHHPW